MNTCTNNGARLRRLPLAAGLLIAFAAGSATAAPGPRAADGTFAFESARPHYGQKQAARLGERRRSSAPQSLVPRATTFVANCNDAGAGSLRNAVAGAASGDTIDLGHLHCARITLTSGAIATPLDDLTLRGSPGHLLAIDGNGSDRVIAHTGAGTLTVSDLVLQHGRYEAPYGNSYGGCVSSSGSVTLNRVAVVECESVSSGASAYAGGVWAAGDFSMTHSAVVANSVRAPLHAVAGGVGAYGHATMRSSFVVGNSTYADGNASYVPYYFIDGSVGGIAGMTSLDVADSVISANSAAAHSSQPVIAAVSNEGGALTFGQLTLVRSTVSDNTLNAISTGSDPTTYGYATALGGGIRGAFVTVVDSTINGNHAFSSADNPAGIAYSASLAGGVGGFDNNDELSITNSTISGNVADFGGGPTTYGDSAGGGVRVRALSPQISNSTIAFNSAYYGGGLAFRAGSSATFNSTIVAKNSPTVGGDMSSRVPLTLVGANNLVGSLDPSVTPSGDTLFGDPRLAPLGFNGGPTPTHMLRSGSPAIDAGNNAAGLMWDQRGTGFPRKIGRSTDIGAVEARGVH